MSTTATATTTTTTTTTATTEIIETSKELFAGTIGACAGIVAGQPLDFIKVRLQSQPNIYKNVTNTVMMTLKNENPLAFFRGMSSPLLGNAPINAIVFGCNSVMNRLFERKSNRYVNGNDSRLQNWLYSSKYSQLFISGSIAGGVQSLVCSPIELIKCRMQVSALPQYSIATYPSAIAFSHYTTTATAATAAASFHSPYSHHSSISTPTTTSSSSSSLPVQESSWRCVKDMYLNHGPRVFLRGFWATFLRDCPSYGVWFLSFEYTKTQLAQRFPKSSTVRSTNSTNNTSSIVTPTPSTSHLLIAGAVAGCLTWTVVYPVDVFKSLIQTMPLETPLHQRKILTVAKQCWKEGGWARCWSGWQSTMIRAAPVSAITFFVYESCLKRMHGVGIKYIDWE